MSFECPTCLSDLYDRVVVIRAGGARYETEFFFCLGCTTMFRDPDCYTRVSEVREMMEAHRADPERELAYKQSLRRQSLTVRLFRNMANCRRGGRASADDAEELRKKYGR